MALSWSGLRRFAREWTRAREKFPKLLIQNGY
jgi:hypothetical protein